MAAALNYTNVNRTCPYVGNASLVNLPMNNKLLYGLFFPAGEYKVEIDMRTAESDERILLTYLHISLPTGTMEDDQLGR